MDFVLTVSSEPLSLFVTQLSVVRGHKPESRAKVGLLSSEADVTVRAHVIRLRLFLLYLLTGYPFTTMCVMHTCGGGGGGGACVCL